MSRLEAQNLDTIQAMQIRMNLQQLFTMDAKTARRFLDRWNAWVQVCDLGPMKRLAKTIMAKAEGILKGAAAISGPRLNMPRHSRARSDAEGAMSSPRHAGGVRARRALEQGNRSTCSDAA